MIPRQNLFELIVERLGLKELSTNEQGEIIYGLQSNILSAINLEILERLSEDDREQLMQLVEVGGEPEAEKFIRSKLPDLDEVMKQVAIDTVEEFKTLSRQ